MSFCPTYAVTTQIFKKINWCLESDETTFTLNGFSGIWKSFSLALFKVLQNDIMDSKYKIRLLTSLDKISKNPYGCLRNVIYNDYFAYMDENNVKKL